MKKMNPVVHFEMPAEDTKRMAEFYTKVFGWQSHFLGEEMGFYVTVSTTETDKQGMVKNPGAINGGFYPKNENMPNNCPSLVIAVDDVKEHIKKITDAGGKVLGNPTDIPGIGKYVSFKDSEGNVCSILQPLMPMSERK
jgi:predicted enzyme related to lactoylglutathione lyase